MTHHPQYLMLGLGKIGLPVANCLANRYPVIGISRSPKADLSPNVTPIMTDARELSANDLGEDAKTISHICLIVTPSESTPQGYHDSYWAIAQNVVQLGKNLPNLQRVVFISSTSVYGQNNGDIIDIDTPIQPPTSATAQVLLNTEQLLQTHFKQKCTIIRPSGIYGKGRLRLVTMAKTIAIGESSLPNNHWTNRIFDTDLINVITHVLTKENPLPVYLATDFVPVPLFGVLDFLVNKQGFTLDLPDQPPLTGKRLISNLPKNWLHYPNYQAGYQTILREISR